MVLGCSGTFRAIKMDCLSIIRLSFAVVFVMDVCYCGVMVCVRRSCGCSVILFKPTLV